MAGEMVERAAAAIANRRAGRRGMPPVSNVLEMLKAVQGGKLVDEVIDDARAVIASMREPTQAMIAAGDKVSQPWCASEDVLAAMIDAELEASRAYP